MDEEIAPRICAWCASKYVEPIHAIPRMEITATMPALITLLVTTDSGLTFETTSINAVAASVTSEIEATILNFSGLPSITKLGRRLGNRPSSVISATAPKKRATDHLAPSGTIRADAVSVL